MKRYNPQTISDNLRLLAERDDLAAHIHQVAGETTPDALPPESPNADDEGPLEEYLNHEILPLIEASTNIDQVPKGARFGFFKRLAMRGLRIIAGKQVMFNYNASVALRVLTAHLQDAHEATRRLSHDLYEQGQRTTELRAHYQELREMIAPLLEAHRNRPAIEDLLDQNLKNFRGQINQMLGLFQKQIENGQQGTAGSGGMTGPSSALPAQLPPAPSSMVSDIAYSLYENSWRGSMEDIHARQEEYVSLVEPYLKKIPPSGRRVVDVGCGRGEFLHALKGKNIAAFGIDINFAFIEQAREEGLSVEHAEAAEWLEQQPADSIGAITAFQVVEHFTPDYLRRFVKAVERALAPGGIALFETLNPGTLASHKWFLMDLSHQCFLFPEVLRFACECAALEHLETKLLHPVADYQRLDETGDDVQKENIRKLNDALFGFQDYYILLRKPLEG